MIFHWKNCQQFEANPSSVSTMTYIITVNIGWVVKGNGVNNCQDLSYHLLISPMELLKVRKQ